MYDTHAHINFNAFKENYSAIIADSLAKGVWLNNVGTQKDTSAEAVKISHDYPEGVYAVVGLHPIHTIAQNVDEEESQFKTREEVFDLEYYRELASDAKVVGIGECGLDYYRLPEGMTIEEVKKIQIPAFQAQLDLAFELDKTLVIHCRASAGSDDAYRDIIEILKAKKQAGKLPRFEIHSFTSSPEICQKFLDLGAMIGLNGIITFDKTGQLDKVIEMLPVEKIFLETDAPYLAPKPFRGKPNLPEYVKYVAEYLAVKKNLPVSEVERITTENAKKLFKIS